MRCMIGVSIKNMPARKKNERIVRAGLPMLVGAIRMPPVCQKMKIAMLMIQVGYAYTMLIAYWTHR